MRKLFKIAFLLFALIAAGTAGFAGASAAYGVNVFAEKQCIAPEVQEALDKGLVPQFDYNLCD